MMAKGTQMTKKSICDLVAYATILIHNNAVDEVMTPEQVDKMMLVFIETFEGNEEKALKFIKGKVSDLAVKLEKHELSAK